MGRAVAERVVAREVLGDDVEPLGGVVGVEDGLAARGLRHVLEGRLNVAHVHRLHHAARVSRPVLGGDGGRDAQAAGIDGVERDAVRVGLGGELLELPRGVVAQRLERQAGGARELVLDRLIQILGDDHGQPVAHVEDRLAARQSRERAHRVLEGTQRELEIVELLVGEGPHARRGGRSVARVLDLLQHAPPVGVELRPHRRHLLELEERLRDDVRIAGEGAAYVQLAIVGHQHHAVARVQLAAQELAQRGEDAVAVEGTQVVVVDVDHEVQALVLGRFDLRQRHRRCDRRGKRLGRGGLLRRLRRLALVHGVEVGDLHRPAILEDLEVVARQTAHAVALLVGDVDVDVDDRDVDRLEETLGLRLGFRDRGRRVLGERRSRREAEQRTAEER